MKITYLLFLFILSVHAEPPRRIQVIPNPESAEDFDHINKGCPENSDCDPVMGTMLLRWKELIKKLQNDTMSAEKRAQFLELFRAKYGIPTEFYTQQKLKLEFKPALNSSPCKEHNPKDPAQKILRGIAFMKSLSTQKASIWRDQSLIEVAPQELFRAQEVLAYFSEKPTRYLLSLGDEPLFIKNEELYVLKEEEGFYYVVKISKNGDWKMDPLDLTKLSEWEDKKQNITCPEVKDKTVTPFFTNEFCKSIWDENSKKLITVKMQQGC